MPTSLMKLVKHYHLKITPRIRIRINQDKANQINQSNTYFKAYIQKEMEINVLFEKLLIDRLAKTLN